VPTYEYRCDPDGVFEVTRPLGTPPEAMTCPRCGNEAARVFSAPMLASFAPPALKSAVEKAEKSRDHPEIVTKLPRQGARRRTPVAPLTPALRRLPRP
jgi:putative FmdB family regulatory protein